MPVILDAIDELAQALETVQAMKADIARIAENLVGRLSSGGMICWMGNGGSAAESQHFAAELVGRYERDRPGLASIALTTDTSVITAVANDFDYSRVFARQIESLCDRADAVIGLSTSGNSPNVIEGIRTAKQLGAYTVGLSGGQGGRLAMEADDCLIVPSDTTARIQEVHLLLGHILCDWIDAESTNGF